MRGMSRNMHAFIAWQDMKVGLVAEDVSWSPDVAQDMVNRVHEMWHDTLLELNRFGMLGNGGVTDDDDDYTEADIHRHEVTFDDGSGDNG